MVALAFPRDRDCYVLSKGDAYPVALSGTLTTRGWQGGQGVQWIDSTKDEFLVDFSDGLYGGFLLWGSNETPDQFTGSSENQVFYGHATFCAGGWLVATRTYERYTYASRQAGPLVENVYTVGERLRFSLRGWWTREDEWTLSGDPRGGNGFFVASVVQNASIAPGYLTIQTSI